MSITNNKLKAKLVLEDGTVYYGYSFGAEGTCYGEVVFNTSMSGYQEIITDPSYKGQIVTMTYPLIGNYGINQDDDESRCPFVEGFVVKECSRIVSNWRANKSLPDYLKEHNIVAIEGVDTRALTRRIRLQGAMKAMITTKDKPDSELIQEVKQSPSLVGRDLVKEVSVDKTFEFNSIGDFKVVAIDCGIKTNILRELSQRGCKVIVVPVTATSQQILDLNPDGLFLSNGPGDPAALGYLVDTVKNLIGKLPIFGICLGHQILGLSFGGSTYKLKFGHHGGNHPVKDLDTGKISITAQNHGFCVDIDSLNKDEIEITHINLNDNTVEGLRHKKFPIFCVQFHPESAPGPHDAKYLFNNFLDLMEKNCAKKN